MIEWNLIMYAYTIQYHSNFEAVKTAPLVIMQKSMSAAVREAARREGFTLSNRWSKLKCIETLRKFVFESTAKNSTEILPSGTFIVLDITKLK